MNCNIRKGKSLRDIKNVINFVISSGIVHLFFFYSAERSRYGTDVMARNRFTDGLVLSLIIFVR
jgi:hypothetical protein